MNSAIQCEEILVNPGDAVAGDDGVVVVPKSEVDEVIEIAHQREEVKEVIKNQLAVKRYSPGKYYPFNENTWKLYKEKIGEKPIK